MLMMMTTLTPKLKLNFVGDERPPVPLCACCRIQSHEQSVQPEGQVLDFPNVKVSNQ